MYVFIYAKLCFPKISKCTMYTCINVCVIVCVYEYVYLYIYMYTYSCIYTRWNGL